MELTILSEIAPETKVLNMEKWRPFDYPILVVGKSFMGFLETMLAEIQKEAPVNMIRIAVNYELNPQNSLLSAFSQMFDVVEAIYFPNQIPTSFRLYSNSIPVPILPTRRYNFLGLSMKTPFCNYSLEFDRGSDEKIEFFLIGFYFVSDSIYDRLQKGTYQVDVLNGAQSFRFDCQNQTGLFKPMAPPE